MGNRDRAMFNFVSKNENTKVTAVCDNDLSHLAELTL